MRPLQDQCEPTPFEDLEKLFITDLGRPISELFDDFNPEPIGVASLAQVHVGRLKESCEEVAVKVRGPYYLLSLPSDSNLSQRKIQHPHLAEFCDIDMEMVEVSLG